MKPQYHIFEPFTKIFTVSTYHINSALFRKVPPNMIRLDLYMAHNQINANIFVQPTTFPIMTSQQLWDTIDGMQGQENRLVYGTMLMCIEYDEPLFNMQMTIAKKLFKKYSCNYFTFYSRWRKTNKFFYGLCLDGDNRILMLIPDTKLESNQSDIQIL